MKIIKRILPYVLAIAIIFAGYFSLDLIKALMPSHKDTVRVFDKPEQDSVFYIGRINELNIYPWDVFDESKCVLLSNQYAAYENTVMWLEEAIFDFGNGSFLPAVLYDFQPEILYDESLNIYFVKEYMYENWNNEECVISCAFSEGTIFCLNCDNKEYINKDLTSAEISNGTKAINSFIQNFQDSQDGTFETDMYTHYSNNPFVSFADNYEKIYASFYTYGVYYPTIDIFGMLTNSVPTVTPYKGELLLIYYYDNTQVVLFYNPRTSAVSGFSIK